MNVYNLTFENWVQRNLVIGSMKKVARRKKGVGYSSSLTLEILNNIREEIRKEEKENAELYYQYSQNPEFFNGVFSLLAKVENEIKNY